MTTTAPRPVRYVCFLVLAALLACGLCACVMFGCQSTPATSAAITGATSAASVTTTHTHFEIRHAAQPPIHFRLVPIGETNANSVPANPGGGSAPVSSTPNGPGANS